MSEVDSCLELHGRASPGVDIRRGLLEPVSQVLALVPRYVRLECPIRHEDPEAVPMRVQPRP